MEGVAETAWLPEPLANLEAQALPLEATTWASAEADGATVDLHSTDFLRLTRHRATLAAAEDALKTYGCGTCGPRGFYGTLDLHLELEDELADFLGTSSAIMYSFGNATISSVVPAFVRKASVLFYDEGLHFAARAGVRLSRGVVRSFAHNDMQALECALKTQAIEDARKPASQRMRRFVLVEGVYANSADLCPLPELIRLRDAYGFYLILDDSLGFGALGANGRGTPEHFNIPASSVDILVGSLENAIGAVGGFCTSASKQIVAHQRLSGTGYCFSASTPAYATAAALAAVRLIRAEPARVQRLHAAAATMRTALRRAIEPLPNVELFCGPHSPIAQVRVSAVAALPHPVLEQALHDVARRARKVDGVRMALQRHSGLSHIQTPRPPSLRLAAHADATSAELEAAAAALAAAITAELSADGGDCATQLPVLPKLFAIGEQGGKIGGSDETSIGSETEDSEVSRDGSFAQPRETPAGTDSMKDEKEAAAREDAADVTVPLLHLIELLRRAIRRYIQRQMKWHASTLLPPFNRLRAAQSPTLHALFSFGHFAGSETFYCLAIPFLTWSFAEGAHLPMFVTFFSVNVYCANWLKNLFSLARVPLAQARAPGTDDYGWPSLYALNAVGLPFFAMRYWYGGFGISAPYSESYPIWTALSYLVAVFWVMVVCGARLYSGASSPADVQGGMLVGGVLIRLWLPVCDTVNAWIAGEDFGWTSGFPQWAVLLMGGISLLAIHPFTPHDPRSWTAFGYSVKVCAFGTCFVMGANQCAQYGCSNHHLEELRLGHPARLAATLAVRNAVGFACLFCAYQAARTLSAACEQRVTALSPHTPCLAPLLRHATVFSAVGVACSLAVPLLFKQIGI